MGYMSTSQQATCTSVSRQNVRPMIGPAAPCIGILFEGSPPGDHGGDAGNSPGGPVVTGATASPSAAILDFFPEESKHLLVSGYQFWLYCYFD